MTEGDCKIPIGFRLFPFWLRGRDLAMPAGAEMMASPWRRSVHPVSCAEGSFATCEQGPLGMTEANRGNESRAQAQRESRGRGGAPE